MKKLFYYPLLALMMLGSFAQVSCTEDDGYDLENIGKDIEIETSVAIPIATVDFYLKDVFDVDGVKGKLTTSEGVTYNAADPEVTAEYMSKLLPLTFNNITGFNFVNVVDNLDLNEVFGEGNAVKSISKLKLFIDCTSDVPLDMKVGLDFTADEYPTKDSEGILGMLREAEVKASQEPVNKTYTFEYDNIAQKLGSSTAMMIPMSFEIPEGVDGVTFVNQEGKQKVHLVIKMWVKGVVNTSNI